MESSSDIPASRSTAPSTGSSTYGSLGGGGSSSGSSGGSSGARALSKAIPRRKRVTWALGLVFAVAFALLVTPSITAERWLGGVLGSVVQDRPAPFTVRIPAFTGRDIVSADGAGAGAKQFVDGGIVIARGEVATADDVANVDALAKSTPRGAMPYAAFFVLTLIFGVIFAHHMRRSTRGRLVRVQLVSLVTIALLAVAVKVVLLASAASVLIVPVALLAIVPTMVLDRVVGLATGILAALVVGLLGPFDLGIAILMLVQAATAGLVVAERPLRARWKVALGAGVIATLFTVATYFLLTYLTTGALPSLGGDPLSSPWFAAVVGPAIATVLVVPSIPLYQLLVGEITHGKLVELEDLSNPLLKQIAERSPGTWQHSLAMANMAEIAANEIGANGRLVRVGAYYHDLGKSLTPKYFIENLEPGETSPHDRLPPEVSCEAIFAHVTEGIVTARKAGLHERIVDFMHMHHGDGVLEYFWGKAREQGNPRGFTVEDFRYPGHPPQSRETAILAICDAVEAASRTLKNPTPEKIDQLVQRIVYGKLHLGQLDESGLSMGDLRRVSDSLRETIRHANHGRIEYPWQKAEQDASASQATAQPHKHETSQLLRLDSLDRRPSQRRTGVSAAIAEPSASMSAPIELGPKQRKSDPVVSSSGPKIRVNEAFTDTTDLQRPEADLAIIETAPQRAPHESVSASRQGQWQASSSSGSGSAGASVGASREGQWDVSASGSAAVSGSSIVSEMPVPPPATGAAVDDDFEREAARRFDDPVDEVPSGVTAPGPAPDEIGPANFRTTGARKKAATLSPPPPVASPIAAPPIAAGLSADLAPRRTLTPADPPAPASGRAADGPTYAYNQTLKPGSDASAFGQTFRTPEPLAGDPHTAPGSPAPANLTLKGSDFGPRLSGLATPGATQGGTLLGPDAPKPNPSQNTLVGAPPTLDRRRAPTVPSDPPVNVPAKKPSELLAAKSDSAPVRPSEPETRPGGAPSRQSDHRLGNPSRDTETNAWGPANPNPVVPTTVAGLTAPRAPAAELSAWAASSPGEPRRNERESFGRVAGLPAEPPASPQPQPPAMMQTLRGPEAPARLPADAEVPPPLFPARPSVHPDASSPKLRPATPTATPTRLGGPPDPVELDNAITNPPPLRRGGGSSPPAHREHSVASRLPGILLEADAIEHDARIGYSHDISEDDVRVTAPRLPVPPVTHTGYVSGQHSIEDAGRTEPSLPRVELPLRAPETDPPRPTRAQDGSWAAGLAARIDKAADEWSLETPIAPPTKAELRSLLGTPDPTREQSLDEIERLHHAARELQSDPEILPHRNIHQTHEVDPDDIEASIEIAPKARTRSPSAIAVAKPKKPE